MAVLAKPITLPVVEWAPDMPALQSQASVNVDGVLPLTADSYGPLASLQPYSAALNKQCLGAAAFIDTGGNVTTFCGDANDLYSLVPGSTDQSIVSKTSGGYSCPSDGQWNFAQFGTRVIATDFSDAQQSYVLGTSTAFADLSADAPKARYSAIIKSFYMVANTFDSTNGDQPQRVWWPANNDPPNWPTPGTAAAAEVESDFVDIVGPGGWNQGIVGNLGTSDGALFQEHAVWRIIYEGPPATFGFYPAEGVRGTPAPNSLVQLGNQVYYLGEDGFYRFDGTSSFPIGTNRVDKTFFKNLDQSHFDKVIGAADPVNKIVVWAYPSTSASSGIPDSLLIYHWQLNRWSQASATVETIARLLSFGYTLDELGTVLGYTIDNLPFPLNSRAWTGGKLLLGAFDTSHKLNYFSGSPVAATVDTAEIQPIPGRRAVLSRVRPLVDGGSPSVSIGTRNRTMDAITFGSAVSVDAIGSCPVRAEGRYHRARVSMAAADTGWTHIEGIQLEELSPGGLR